MKRTLRRQQKTRAGTAVALWIISIAVAACGGSSPAVPPVTPPTLESLVVQSTPGPLERSVDGTVEAVHQVTISAQTAGRLVEWRQDVNDAVTAGALLARLKGTEQRAGLQAAEAAVAEARARQAEAAAQYERIDAMYQRHVVSRLQWDQAKANQEAAAARLSAADAQMTQARERVGYTEVRAPYAGIVTERRVQVGEAVVPGTPLITVASMRDLRVTFQVPQHLVDAVRHYQRAVVSVAGDRVALHAITIFPEASPPSTTFQARADLPASSPAVAPGQYVKVDLMIGEAERLLIPVSALVERSEVSGVYVIGNDGAVDLRFVRKGHVEGDRVEILAGIAAGERIAVDATAARARLMAAQP